MAVYYQGYVLPLTDDIAESATYVVVYNEGTSTTASIYRQREGEDAYYNGTIIVDPSSRYVTFFGNGVFDIEVLDSSYGLLAKF